MANRRHWVYEYRRDLSLRGWHYYVPRWLSWEMPWMWLRRVHRHRRQRAQHGFSTWDWISFDTYICRVIADACKGFREDGHGYPGGMTEREWHDILTRIEEPLREWADDKFSFAHEGEVARYKAAQDAMRLFAEHLGAFWN